MPRLPISSGAARSALAALLVLYDADQPMTYADIGAELGIDGRSLGDVMPALVRAGIVDSSRSPAGSGGTRLFSLPVERALRVTLHEVLTAVAPVMRRPTHWSDYTLAGFDVAIAEALKGWTLFSLACSRADAPEGRLPAGGRSGKGASDCKAQVAEVRP